MQDTGIQPETVAPLARGSVSLGLYRQQAPTAHAAIEQAVEQAVLAERCGFDGVTLSEHHLGHPDYFPNPLLAAAVVLSRTTRIWAGPMPMLLTVRPAATVVEDAAWILAAFPGRVALGVAAGNVAAEYALGESPDTVVDCFARRLETLSGALVTGDPDQPVNRDPAVAAAGGLLPVVSAARSRTATRRAARLGLGILHSPVSGPERLAELTREYLAAGGSGRRVLIAGAWLDDAAPAEGGNDHAAAWTARGSGAQVAKVLRDVVAASGADAVNVRLHVAGAGPAQTSTQIEAFGQEVLPALRHALAGVAA